MNRMLLGYSPDLDVFDEAPVATLAQGRIDREVVALETDYTEVAAELLDVVGSTGLDALLGRLVRGAAVASGRGLNDAVVFELVRLLQIAARRVLPALHSPATVDASTAATRASRFFGIELEGLSPEDQEFEAARRFAQLTAEAARQAAFVPVRLPPAAAAHQAAVQAALRYAPGWVTPGAQALAVTTARSMPSFPRAGRWVRPRPGVIVLNH